MRHAGLTLFLVWLIAGCAFGQDGSLASNEVTSLTVEEARKLARFNQEELTLDGLKALGPDVAAALATFEGSDGIARLSLRALTSLSPETATALASFKGDELDLSGIEALDREVAVALAAFEGNFLCLDGLKSLSDEGAKALTSFGGVELSLKGLQTLSREAQGVLKKAGRELPAAVFVGAEALVTSQGAILKSTNEIKTLRVDQAKALASSGSYALHLNGLVQLTPEVAKSLAEFEGDAMHLDGLKELSASSAAALAGFKGRLLSLNGLPVIAADAAEALSRFEGAVLELSGLGTLSRDAATSLAERAGTTALSNRAKQSLQLGQEDMFFVAASRSPWRIESDTGLNDAGRVIDTALSTALGEMTREFGDQSFCGITLGDAYVAPEEQVRANSTWLLPVETPDEIAAQREAQVRVLVDAHSTKIVGIVATYREPLAAMAEDIAATFGKTRAKTDERYIDFLDTDVLSLKYSFPRTVVRVTGHKFATTVLVLDRDYVERSLRPFANAVLTACRWAKQVVRYGNDFELGPLPDVPLADLEPQWSSNRHVLLMSDRTARDAACRRKKSGQNEASEWDVAACYAGPEGQGAVVNFQAGASTGIPLLLTSRDDYARRSLANVGPVCPDLFHEVANALLQHEFPPAGDSIRVLNTKKLWDPDATLPALALHHELDPSHKPDDEVIEQRVHNVVSRGDTQHVRGYQWTDREGWLVTLTESLVLTIAR